MGVTSLRYANNEKSSADYNWKKSTEMYAEPKDYEELIKNGT